MLLGVIYPRRCPICDDIVVPRGDLICSKCKKEVSYIGEPVCKKCGKEIESSEKEYCYDCSRSNHAYDCGAAVFRHNKKIKDSIYKFKYSGRREYADFYVEEIAKKLEKTIRYWKSDVIIPVPLHQSKKIVRGYNQAEILAVLLGKKLQIPVDTQLLKRVEKTIPQKDLDYKERRKNIERAFKIGTDIVQYRKAILMDDIYTTGSTIDACAKVLKKKNIQCVHFIALSIGDGI